MADLGAVEKENAAECGGADEEAAVLYFVVVEEPACAEKKLDKIALAGGYVVGSVDAGIGALKVKLFVPAGGDCNVVTIGKILGGAEAVDILCFVVVLPEERHLGEDGT